MGQKFKYLNIDCNTCPQPCTDCEQEEGCKYPSFTDCVTYNNGYLPNIGLPLNPETEVSLTEIIKAIDDKIGELASGSPVDWNSYDTNCLAPITSQKDFVEKSSLELCNLKESYTTFTTSTYPLDISNINGRIDGIINPQLTSAGCLAIGPTDTLNQIQNKVISKVEDICESLDLSSVIWNACITSSTTPSTVAEGFMEVLDQICILANRTTSGGDTYKIKVSSSDPNPDYIFNKIVTDSCLSMQLTGNNKLKLGLSFTPPIYSFNQNDFDVTAGLQEPCGQNIQISLKNPPSGGSVTSVRITSSDFNVTGSPITTLGTIAINMNDIIPNPGNFNNVTVNSKGLVTSGSMVNYLTTETDPTVPAWVKAITQTDINNWNNNSFVLNPASTTVLGGIKVGDGLFMDNNNALNTKYTEGYGIHIDPNFIISLTGPVQTSLSKANTALQNITGYITAGANISITGSGTLGSPYEISSSGGGGGGGVSSVGVSVGGNAIQVSNSPITSSGNISLQFQGTSGDYIDGEGNIASFPPFSQEIDDNSYNYGKTIASYDGLDTQGGFATKPTLYVDATGGSVQVVIPEDIYQIVIDGGNETEIAMPDPSLFLGRELKIKLRNASNVTAFSGGAVYNYSTQVFSVDQTPGVSLRFVSGTSPSAGLAVWEIMEVSEINSSLLL